MQVYIKGAYHSPFGKLSGETLQSLYEKAIVETVKAANIDPAKIDAIFLGNYSGGGFNNQEHLAPYAANVMEELRFKPMFRLENACASGSAAVHQGISGILSGEYKNVLVIGVEKMLELTTPEISRVLAMATLYPKEGANGVDAPCMFATLAKGYASKFGRDEEFMRTYFQKIAAKSYGNAVHNPVAQFKKGLTEADLAALPEEKNPIIHAPLRLHDCSLISDGCAGLVLSAEKSGVKLSGWGAAMDYLDIIDSKKTTYQLDGAQHAVKKALLRAGVTIEDIGVAEVHDCFTITELMCYSALGLCEAGEEHRLLDEGVVYPEGDCVVNPSGGLKAKGHPIGATGVAMHALIYQQLIGEALGVQVETDRGITLNIGGSGGSNIVSILERA
ncbi:MAG: propanoyl-CoA acyltransferase [Cyclobacteriaceae bacterium]|nr:propanoyl-CoA acyltransferase [Cyclobacteriaceae bacterium]MCH8516511.1 propanoyl-CoA acyltransferase [Cyclobacteriaceae bacterium]